MTEDLRARAARSLLSTLPLVMRSVGAAMRESSGDVTPHQHRLLTMIAAHPRTLSQVADIQGVTPATATTLITTLEARGWVRRTHDEVDRRRVVVTVTESGCKHLAVAQEAAECAMANALESLSAEELERLIGGLEVLSGLSAGHGHHCAGIAGVATHEDGTRSS